MSFEGWVHPSINFLTQYKPSPSTKSNQNQLVKEAGRRAIYLLNDTIFKGGGGEGALGWIRIDIFINNFISESWVEPNSFQTNPINGHDHPHMLTFGECAFYTWKWALMVLIDRHTLLALFSYFNASGCTFDSSNLSSTPHLLMGLIISILPHHEKNGQGGPQIDI